MPTHNNPFSLFYSIVIYTPITMTGICCCGIMVFFCRYYCLMMLFKRHERVQREGELELVWETPTRVQQRRRGPIMSETPTIVTAEVVAYCVPDECGDEQSDLPIAFVV